MIVAVASDGNTVSAHFGHCEGFNIYDIEEEKILKQEFKENPGHKPGFLPVFLKSLNTEVIITGGMGETAQQLFNENSIEVVTGARGLSEEAVKQYIKGELKSTGSICNEHQHEDHCNG